jgi:hypothetical protein
LFAFALDIVIVVEVIVSHAKTLFHACSACSGERRHALGASANSGASSAVTVMVFSLSVVIR